MPRVDALVTVSDPRVDVHVDVDACDIGDDAPVDALMTLIDARVPLLCGVGVISPLQTERALARMRKAEEDAEFAREEEERQEREAEEASRR